MKAYSPDLCCKIARAYDEGAGSQRQLARQFRVSLAFIQKMRRRQRATGQLAATQHTGGRKPLLDEAALSLISTLIREQNDLTLSELCDKVSEQRGVRVSLPTMYRAVRRLKLPHKKS
ncbi:MAG TPA: transposase [Blastocatellia bacterium]|nr:transposase [Blastocatellia bacterium]